MFLASAGYLAVEFLLNIGVLRECQVPGENKPKRRSLSGGQGLTETLFLFQDLSSINGVKLWAFVRKTFVFFVVAL